VRCTLRRRDKLDIGLTIRLFSKATGSPLSRIQRIKISSNEAKGKRSPINRGSSWDKEMTTSWGCVISNRNLGLRNQLSGVDGSGCLAGIGVPPLVSWVHVCWNLSRRRVWSVFATKTWVNTCAISSDEREIKRECLPAFTHPTAVGVRIAAGYFTIFCFQNWIQIVPQDACVY